MTVKSVPTVVLLVVMAASLAAQSKVDFPTSRQQRETEIREAVLHYQISTWEFSAASYCVQVNGKDADKDFLLRLRSLPVKKASECRKKRAPGLPRDLGLYSIVDKRTKKNAVLFDIGEVRLTSATHADVDGGYHCGGLCWAAGTYRVGFDGTRWTVTAFDIQIQS
jgi:hypothetical protein